MILLEQTHFGSEGDLVEEGGWPEESSKCEQRDQRHWGRRRPAVGALVIFVFSGMRGLCWVGDRNIGTPGLDVEWWLAMKVQASSRDR